MKGLGEITKRAILVTADATRIYPSIPHDGGLEVFRKRYDKFKGKMIPPEGIMKMANFMLKSNLFEFDCKFYQQILGAATGIQFVPSHACIFMDYIETEFLKTQAIKPWSWKRFTDDIYLDRF